MTNKYILQWVYREKPNDMGELEWIWIYYREFDSKEEAEKYLEEYVLPAWSHEKHQIKEYKLGDRKNV